MLWFALLWPLLSIAFGEEYSVAVIPPPPGFTSFFQACGINASGQVAGTGLNGGADQAFLGSPEGSVPIALPAGYKSSRANGLNNSGQVTGYVTDPPSAAVRAFIGTPTGATLVPLPPGWTTSAAYGVNDAGVTVGGGGLDPTGSVFQVFVGGTAVPLGRGWTSGSLPGSWGYAINNEGQITGFVHSGLNARGTFSVNGAFIGTAEGVKLIPPPSGWTSTVVGYGINDYGEVVGIGSNGIFVYTASETVSIPPPTGAAELALNGYGNINSAGMVVGWSDAGGWIWSFSRGTVLLTSLVPSGWNVTDALSISDTGLVLARASYNGGVSQFVELSPVSPGDHRR